MNVPCTNQRVGIVLPVALSGSLHTSCHGRAWIALREHLKGQQCDNQAAHCKITPNMFEHVR